MKAFVGKPEKLLETQPDERAHYRLLPIGLLFFFSGLILFAGTYLNRYQGNYDSHVYDENTKPSKVAVVAAKVDPLVLGKRQFEAACINCHQSTGVGVPGTYPPLAGIRMGQWTRRTSGYPDRALRTVGERSRQGRGVFGGGDAVVRQGGRIQL